MGIKLLDTDHDGQGPQTEIFWNDQFIAGWENQEQKIPDEMRSMIQSMMQEVWLHGRQYGRRQIQAELKNVMGIQ